MEDEMEDFEGDVEATEKLLLIIKDRSEEDAEEVKREL